MGMLIRLACGRRRAAHHAPLLPSEERSNDVKDNAMSIPSLQATRWPAAFKPLTNTHVQH